MFFSPAKINLYFHILKKRSDGFHEIASLYQAIDLGDKLAIDPSEGEDRITCTDLLIPTDSSNLILRAASLFREKTGSTQHFSFSLEKNIPIESGLGGGSSNAATTLWALNQLMQTGLSDETLAKWGAEIGSDVPFFFTRGRAICTGRGEKLSSVEPVVHKSFWIAKPLEGLSTQLVYQALVIQQGIKQGVNDLEPPAFQLLPELKTFKEALLAMGFDKVQMTGSGSAFYCLGDVTSPKLENAHFYRVSFITRSSENWYKFP